MKLKNQTKFIQKYETRKFRKKNNIINYPQFSTA